MVARIETGQKSDPGWSTNRCTPSRFIPHALRGQPVNIWSEVVSTITTNPVPPHIINHDEYYIGSFNRMQGCRQTKTNE